MACILHQTFSRLQHLPSRLSWILKHDIHVTLFLYMLFFKTCDETVEQILKDFKD